jgi:G3E family GTPase
VKQVALADRLLITKSDLVADTFALESRLRLINPGARIETILHGQIDPARLFGAALFDPDKNTADAARWLNEHAYSAACDAAHGHAGDAHHRHDASIQSFVLAFDEPLDWMAVSQWLAHLRRTRGEDLLRVKGILNLAGEPTPVAIHGVHHVFHPPVALAGWLDADRRSRIVFITRGIAREEALAAWQRRAAV